MMSLKTVKLLFFGGIILFTILIIALIMYINVSNKKTGDAPIPPSFPTPVPLLYQSPAIESFAPPITQALIPGQHQIFTVEFNKAVPSESLRILLTKKGLGNTQDTAASVPISADSSSGGKVLIIHMLEPVNASHEYSLVVIDKNNIPLVSSTYASAHVEISPAPSNNLALREYLPYETTTYRLSYNENRNSYIFNFKINPESPDNIQSQYEQAKIQAEDWIQSRGIDINSIVIEWRHS